MRTILSLALVAALSGCDASEKEMLDSVRAKLKDPNSAEFTQLEMKKVGSMKVLCGMVNAKNSFGGYVGAKPFTVAKFKGGEIEDFTDRSDCKSILALAEDASKQGGER